MTKTTAWIKLIRLQNLIIVAFTQIIIKYCLINLFVENFCLNPYYFTLYLMALLSIIAGGYIINDICDVKTDKINKNEVIIETYINASYAYNIYIYLNIFGSCMGFLLAFLLNKIIFGFIFIFFAVSLYRYSKKNKRSFIIGNLQIALLTALSILNLILFDLILYEKGTIPNQGSLMIVKIIFIYAVFSFILTLIREIIKDIEDIKGDKAIKANTLAITIGVKRSKELVIILSTISMLAILYFQYFQYSIINSKFEYQISIWGANNIALYYVSLIQIFFILLCYKIYVAIEKKEFYFISQLSKVIMILGIISIPLFTYLHIK